MKKTLFLLALVCLNAMADSLPKRIDLSGTWQFALDRQHAMKPDDVLTETVQLPGTTDTNRKGDVAEKHDETTHLTRHYSYKGRAWYRREVEIPADWKDQSICLFLERTKPSEVYVDGQLVGSSNDISTPQVFDLTAALSPGRHTLAIMVDNGSGVPSQLYASSHAYTEDTQTNWNGIIGRLELIAEYAEAVTGPAPCTLTPTPSIHPNFRDFHIEGQHFFANGHKIFLRGKHDACVWPLTGHVAMDVDSWRNYLGNCAAYGMNHVRFHSWCPPEAAFVAADELGIILQPELPFWGSFDDKDSLLMAFLHKEGENILRWYGHHPSFRMFALGNELWGSIDKMAQFIADFRTMAPDKVYTFGSNYYLGYQGVKPGMDYFTTCRVGGEGWGNYNTHTRGSFSFADAADGGMINHFYPNTQMNFTEGCSLATVPIISHETGQFQTYPDYDEIQKYTGVLYPYNLEVFRSRLQQAGMLDQAKDFHRASGLWSLQLYKQDIEMDLRTPNMAGFQLLDLQDYPGQGSAYVGILDAFMDSKGLISPQEWCDFCSDVVPLFLTEKLCVTNDKPLRGKIQIANYSGKSLKGKKLFWTLAYTYQTANHHVGGTSNMVEIENDGTGLIDICDVSVDLSDIDIARKCLFRVWIVDDEDVAHPIGNNSWNIWVYPADTDLTHLKRRVIVTNTLTDRIARQLERGKSVLLMPDSSKLCVGGLFQTDYWN